MAWDSSLLPDFLVTFPLLPLRRLRLVIGGHEHYYRDLTPKVLAQLLMCLPYLEELVLDSEVRLADEATQWTAVCRQHPTLTGVV